MSRPERVGWKRLGGLVVEVQLRADLSARAAAGRNGLLAGLPPDELDHLGPFFELVRLRPKRWFSPAGVPLQHVFFPLEGLMALMVSTARGTAVEAAAVGREGMLGVSVVLGANEPPFDMLCQVGGDAVRLPADTCVRYVQQLPTFRQRLLRYALAVLHEATRSAACNGLHSVEQRLARWLLLCCQRIGTSTFPVTHEMLAHMLGVTRPFVTQTVARLTSAGLIQHQRGVMHIIDSAGLEALACEDYRLVVDTYTRLLG